MHEWHRISAAISLLSLLLFAVTGITLNHAADIEARPQVTGHRATLPETVRAPLAEAASNAAPGVAVPAALRDWVAAQWQVRLDGHPAEWSEDELYVSLPRPGGDAWLQVDLASGDIEYERTDRGWIAWLNDLHKGRNTGLAWRFFIDLFALACLVFAASGLLILKMHASRRPFTWPMVGLGVLVPAMLAILFIH